MKFRDDFCLPKNIDLSDPENEIIVPMNDLLNHQVEKLFEIYPDLKNDMKILEEQYPGIQFRLIFKFGADESSGYKEYNFKLKSSDQESTKTTTTTTTTTTTDGNTTTTTTTTTTEKERKETKSLFSSQLSIVCLNAVLPNGEIKTLWTNKNVNSIYGNVPLRHAYEKENKGKHIYILIPEIFSSTYVSKKILSPQHSQLKL